MNSTEKEIELLLTELTGNGINTISNNDPISSRSSILLTVLKIVKDRVLSSF